MVMKLARNSDALSGSTQLILNLLFILAITIISFGLARIILSRSPLDETAIPIASIPLAILISGLIFLSISRLSRRSSKGENENENEREAIKGVVSEIAEIKGRNGLTCFRLKINDRSYELPLLPETYFLLNLHEGERVIIPLTQEVRRYLGS